PSAYVLHLCTDRDRSARFNSLRAKPQIRILEFRVAQSKTEWIKRLALEVTVSAALHRVVSERRQLFDRFVKRDRETAARVVIPEQHVGDRRPAFFARIPAFENRRHLFVGPIHSNGTAVEQNEYDGLAQGLNFLQQFFLLFRKIDAGPIAAAKSFEGDLHFFAFNQWRQA